MSAGTLRLAQPAGRRAMVATALGAGLVLHETTVVNVALPAIGQSLDASLTGTVPKRTSGERAFRE